MNLLRIGEGSGVLKVETPFDAVVRAVVPAPVRAMRGRFDRTARPLGRLGSLEVRLARSRDEVKQAQQLRYRVFYEEMSAQPSRLQRLVRRDFDAFDRYCDHLLVIDHDRGESGEIVGTYRLMRQSGADLAGRFYTEGEFRVSELISRHPGKRFLELGRSCVLKDYRGKRTVELLWQGIWAYVLQHRLDVLFGCASLNGTDPESLALPLAFLRENAPAPEEWRVPAQPGCGIALSARTVDPSEARRALASLPPLLKGYLRLGGHIGPEAVVDRQFGTTDVLVVLPVANINPRYIDYYGAAATRFSS